MAPSNRESSKTVRMKDIKKLPPDTALPGTKSIFLLI